MSYERSWIGTKYFGILFPNCSDLLWEKIILVIEKNVLFVLHYKFFSACTAQSNNDLRGSCHTPEECGELGGTQDGNCASGFGTCCVI